MPQHSYLMSHRRGTNGTSKEKDGVAMNKDTTNPMDQNQVLALGVGNKGDAASTTTWAKWLLRGGLYTTDPNNSHSSSLPPPPLEQNLSAAGALNYTLPQSDTSERRGTYFGTYNSTPLPPPPSQPKQLPPPPPPPQNISAASQHPEPTYSRSHNKITQQIRSTINAGVRQMFGLQVNSATSFFKAIDRDASGELDAKEISNGLKRLGASISIYQIKDWVNHLDKDQSGHIDAIEFITHIDKCSVEVADAALMMYKPVPVNQLTGNVADQEYLGNKPHVLPVSQDHLRNELKYAEPARLRFWVKILREEVIREAAYNNHQSILISQLRALVDAQMRELVGARVSLRKMKGNFERANVQRHQIENVSSISHDALRMAGKSRMDAQDEREALSQENEKLREENARLREANRAPRLNIKQQFS